ncbi:hypothetical protein QSL92_000566 [Campylobacter jejuni]|nr:hypothetical protein [Campylobacter jejuni]
MSQKYDILFFFCDILFFRRQKHYQEFIQYKNYNDKIVQEQECKINELKDILNKRKNVFTNSISILALIVSVASIVLYFIGR